MEKMQVGMALVCVKSKKADVPNVSEKGRYKFERKAGNKTQRVYQAIMKGMGFILH